MARICDIYSLCIVAFFVLWSLVFMPPQNTVHPSRISLTGTVVNGEITDDGSGSVKLTLRLRLDLKNVSSEPVLILRRELEMVERKIIADPSDAAGNKYLFKLEGYPSIDRSPEWEELRKRVKKPSAPSDVIRTLIPNETWTMETTDWFFINKRTNIDLDSKPWKAIREASPVWLQVTVELWPKNIEPRPERQERNFGKMLQHRWQKFGDLQLESLTSEPIPLDFSSFAVSRVSCCQIDRTRPLSTHLACLNHCGVPT